MSFSCAKCAFYEGGIPASEFHKPETGECARYPKRRKTLTSNWCGEFIDSETFKPVLEIFKEEKANDKLN